MSGRGREQSERYGGSEGGRKEGKEWWGEGGRERKKKEFVCVCECVCVSVCVCERERERGAGAGRKRSGQTSTFRHDCRVRITAGKEAVTRVNKASQF